ARFSDDIAAIGDAVHRLGVDRSDSTNYLFWSDPLDSRIAGRLTKETLTRVRAETEGVLTHLAAGRPRTHANAARVMALAARRLNYLARDYQIASEARYYYDDAMAHANDARKGLVYRGLYIAKYNFWEMRDNMEELAALYAAAWSYESRPGHLASNLERYHRAAQQAIDRADKINAMTFEDYLRNKQFPTFDQTLGLGHR
nr:hypothetical protein [Candidatus Eremiobacteraeota bacterium]